MRSASFRRNAALRVFVGLVALSFFGAAMTAPSAQAWVPPAADDAAVS